MEEVQIESPPRDATLSYIDKVYTTMSRSWDTANRMLSLQVIVCVVILALSLGAVNADDAADVAGLKLRIPLWVLLTIGSVISSLLTASMWYQEEHAAKLHKELERLYKSLGYT